MPSSDDPLGLRNSLRMPKPKMSMSLSSGRKKAKPDKEPDPSFLQSLGHAGLGLAGAVGNTLDLPGSMVRDTLAGQNPFDQLLSPFSDQDRTSGRDLIRKYGLAGKEDTWGNFFGGLGAEIATDPFVLTGLKPLGNTAKGLSQIKAGTRGASTLAGGIARGERALATGKIPFTKIDWALGTGSKAVKAGQKLDQAYNTVRYSKPGRIVAGHMSAAAKGTITERGQKLAAKIFAGEQKAQVTEKKRQIGAAVQRHRAGADSGVEFRHLMENPDPSHPLNSLATDLRESSRRLYRKRAAMGQVSGAMLDDPYVEHVFRQVSRGKSARQFRNAPQFSMTSSTDRSRKWILKSFKHGTRGVNDLFSDPRWKPMLDSAAAQNLDYKDIHSQVGDELRKMNAGGAIFDPKHQVGDSLRDRANELAHYILGASDETLSKGLFQNDPIADVFSYNTSARKKILAGRHIGEDLFANTLPKSVTSQEGSWLSTGQPIKLPKRADLPYVRSTPGQMTVADIYRNLGVDSRKSVARLLASKGIEPTTENLFASLRSAVPEDVAKDLISLYPKRVATPAEGAIAKGLRSYMNLWKGSMLSMPSTKVRDLISGFVQSHLRGTAGTRDYIDAHHIYHGRTIKGLANAPAVRQWLKENHLAVNDANATEAIRSMYAAHGPGDAAKHTDVTMSHIQSSSPTLSHILGQVPGYQASTEAGNVADVFRALTGKSPDATWNPVQAKVRGVGDATETTFAPLAASDKVSSYTDTMNRLSGFVNLVKQGWDPAAAMKKINEAQVNYNPATFSETEKLLKKIFPFYSFSSRITKSTAKELAGNPGGLTAAMVRAQNNASDKSGTVPQHIEDSSAIRFPWGEPDDGTKRYLTGMGLMSDEAMQFLQPDPQKLSLELLGRTSPFIQQPISLATGQSFFQKGPEGGRPINEMDPNIGRLLANVTGSRDSIRYPGEQYVEAALNASPFSRLVTTARQLTDTRKDQLAKAANTLTGLRFSDVSPDAQLRTLAEKTQIGAKKIGAKLHTSVYFPDGLSEDTGVRQEVNNYKNLLKHLAKQSKKRSKAKKKATQK